MIHPTAVINPKAKIASDVEVGPYVIIGSDVSIGTGTKISSHAVIAGFTEIGCNNLIGVGAVIGLEPQDLAYQNEKSFVRIGNSNNIREYVQIHRGTKEGSSTIIGDHNFFLGFSHVAHNCKVGSHVIVANGALLAGYVEVEDYAFISGLCLVHQFTRIGESAMMRGGSRISLDLPPYCIADDANTIRGINTIGLERRGFSKIVVREIKKNYKELFYSSKPLAESIKDRLAQESSKEILHFLEFIKAAERGICRPQI
ncbi:MAG: acyl-ACP--UDP-N-acetylglucosamine O-acyltransferase [Elusimicrobia bacterium]|nr:acyl-ACP--UDP-N-acetylglucosamine O-acyltransferase [Elusimicrobiota bacterium]